MKKQRYFTAVTHFFFALPQYYRLLHCKSHTRKQHLSEIIVPHSSSYSNKGIELDAELLAILIGGCTFHPT